MHAEIKSIGPVVQLSYVPADMAAALRYWTETMGVGPFYMMRHIQPPRMLYRGQDTRFDFSVGLAYWGDMQIELIEQHDDVPSIYSNWVRGGHEGLHHVCQFTDDLTGPRSICTERGGEIVQEILLDGAAAIYVDFGGGPGTLLEIFQVNEQFRHLFQAIHRAASKWDGSRPVREIDEIAA